MDSFMEVGQGPNWGSSAKEEDEENSVHYLSAYLY
jgi:hypothetical protein